MREREFTVRCMDTAMLTTGHRREGVSATDLTSPRKGLAAPVASSPSTGAKLGETQNSVGLHLRIVQMCTKFPQDPLQKS